MSQIIEGLVLEDQERFFPDQTMRLGEAAVRAYEQLADLRSADDLRGGRPLPAHIEEALAFSVSIELENVRQTIEEIDTIHDKSMNTYCRLSAPPHLTEAAGGRSSQWRYWLTEGASDEQLLEFLTWNLEAMLAMQNDPGVQQEIARQKTDYKIAAARGMREGWLSLDAARAIEQVDEAPVYIGDPFDTYFQDMVGYHMRGADWVVVGGERFNVRWRSGVLNQLKAVTKHELNHLALGRLVFWWLNEIATEHIARSLEEGQPDYLHPHARNKVGTIYDTERMLGHHLLTNGQIKIPVREMTLAYSSTVSEEKGEFLGMLSEAWSHVASDNAAMWRLDEFIMRHEEELLSSGVREIVARREAVKVAYNILCSNPERVFRKSQYSFNPQAARVIFKENRASSANEII